MDKPARFPNMLEGRSVAEEAVSRWGSPDAFWWCGVLLWGIGVWGRLRGLAGQFSGVRGQFSGGRWAVTSWDGCSAGSGGRGCDTGISSVPVVGSGLRRPR
jgi:hypothetical protein